MPGETICRHPSMCRRNQSLNAASSVITSKPANGADSGQELLYRIEGGTGKGFLPQPAGQLRWHASMPLLSVAVRGANCPDG